MSPVGFLVWNPAGRLPTRVHDTLGSAVAESERLHKLHRGERFIVMSPVLTAEDARTAKAWATGKADGLAQAHREIMHAEARTDRALDQIAALQKAMHPAQMLLERARRYQGVVADCLTWFAGFQAAHVHRASRKQPWTPEREALRELNRDFLDVLDAQGRAGGHEPWSDMEIPF